MFLLNYPFFLVFFMGKIFLVIFTILSIFRLFCVFHSILRNFISNFIRRLNYVNSTNESSRKYEGRCISKTFKGVIVKQLSQQPKMIEKAHPCIRKIQPMMVYSSNKSTNVSRCRFNTILIHCYCKLILGAKLNYVISSLV